MNEEAKMPDCEDGYVTQTITRYDNGGNEQFFLISDGSLFHHDIIHKFCLDDATEVGDIVADTVAIICRPNPCMGKIGGITLLTNFETPCRSEVLVDKKN